MRKFPPSATWWPFNGATAFQPWIHDIALWNVRLVAAFNGATAFQPWILDAENINGAQIESLQWSHGLSAMDT